MELVSFILSFILSAFLSFSKFGLDRLTSEPQKFHKKPVPRIGGLAIFVSTVVGILSNKFFSWLLPLTIAFVAGFLEDITRKISERVRFVILTVGALITIFTLNVVITDLKEAPVLGYLVHFYPFAVLFTTIAIVGLANAFNIIDGLNGLSSGTALLVLLSVMYVALQVNDFQIYLLSKILFFSTLGFFLWNFPFGKIFLGDGGAYFIGFYIACLIIVLNQQHQKVSDWYPVGVAIYPIFEALFSIFRRALIFKTNPLKPDSYHLHSLIYSFLKGKLPPHIANPLTALSMLLIQTPFIVMVSLKWSETGSILSIICLFCILYLAIYVFFLKKTLNQ